MKAAVVVGPRQVCLQELVVPEPADREVRVRIEGCGVCGSNLPPWKGAEWFQYPFPPGQPGHEGWGVIDAVGSRVVRWKVGDRVAALSCRAFAEFDIAHEEACVALPELFRGKPFPGEALGCAINVLKRCNICPGDTVAIVGIGFLGAMLTALAVKAGAIVVALARRRFPLEMARAFGAAEVILLDDHKRVVERVKNLTGGAGCDRVIEAAGAQWPLDIAGEITKERGRLIIAGYHQDGPRQVNMQLWNWQGFDVINAHERDPKIYVEGMRDAVNRVISGEIDPSRLYTHSFPINRIAEAFAAMEQRPDNFLKALITT